VVLGFSHLGGSCEIAHKLAACPQMDIYLANIQKRSRSKLRLMVNDNKEDLLGDGKAKWYALGESNPSFQNENLTS
jgi:hypothetical protein